MGITKWIYLTLIYSFKILENDIVKLMFRSQSGFAQLLLILILLAGIGLAVYLTQFTQIFKPKADEGSITNRAGFFKITDSDSNGYSYAYAPSIIYEGGKYHLFYCSPPVNFPESLDSIRHISSTDGINWTAPVIKLTSHSKRDPSDETGFSRTSACDPSVVFYQGYYYLYYSSTWKSKPEFKLGPTVVSVARSETIDGTYLTYTDKGTWEKNPTDAKNIVVPIDPYGDAAVPEQGIYGSGQQSVIAKDGKLLMWHSDRPVFGDPFHIYMRESTNPIDWSSPPKITDTSAHSPDVKYDSIGKQFIMTKIMPGQGQNSSLHVIYSKDGINWINEQTIIPEEIFPDWSHNVGVSSDRTGTLIPGKQLIGFGTPYDLRLNDVWGQWDLYGIFIDLKSTPIGSLDEASCQTISGWTCNAADFSKSTEVHLYFDGIPGSSGASGIPGIIADKPSNSIVSHYCGDKTNKSFSFSTPESLKDGRTHEIRAYAINTAGNYNPLLNNSPKIIQCQSNPTISPSPSSTKKVGDLNDDGSVDVLDFGIFVRDYRDQNLRSDFNKNSEVDIFDFNILIQNLGH